MYDLTESPRPRSRSVLKLGTGLILLAACAVGSHAADSPELAAVKPALSCDELAQVDVSDAVGAPTRIAAATLISDDKPAPYCRANIVVDDYGKLEMHLPVAAWTQRLLFGGGPGAQAGGPSILGGFVTASWQDIGNRGHEDVFATHYEYRVNFAYRIMHLQVLAAKALVAKFYNQAPRYSYYNACSEPGREGMMEVQRFPDDFDGVAAGCPPINDVINNGLYYAWNIVTNTGADGNPVITADKLPVLHQAVLDECDLADGLKDGIISDPFNCHPGLSAAECTPGRDPSSCLTAEQIHTAREIYRGAHDAQGEKMEPIGALPGTELAWGGIMVPYSDSGIRNGNTQARDGTVLAVRSEFSEPPLPKTFTLADLKWDRGTFNALTKLHYLYDATDPDLTAFAKAGHKLILWQSLADVNVLPAHAVLYYTALQQQMGAKTVDRFARLYLLPGVFHCGGGDGPSVRDFLTPLIAWVEHGVAPGALQGAHTPRPRDAGAGGTAPGGVGPGGLPREGTTPVAPDLTRPIYPYPYTARYIGTGDIRDAANYVQGPARSAPAELFNWLGSGFYAPHYEKWCTGTDTTLRCKDSR